MAAYIKFAGIDGECKDKDHKGWTDLGSFAQGVFKPGGGVLKTDLLPPFEVADHGR